MTQELIEYMEETLGIIGRVYIDLEFTPKVLEDQDFSPTYEDVDQNIWTLKQIQDAFENNKKIKLANLKNTHNNKAHD